MADSSSSSRHGGGGEKQQKSRNCCCRRRLLTFPIVAVVVAVLVIHQLSTQIFPSSFWDSSSSTLNSNGIDYYSIFTAATIIVNATSSSSSSTTKMTMTATNTNNITYNNVTTTNGSHNNNDNNTAADSSSTRSVVTTADPAKEVFVNTESMMLEKNTSNSVMMVVESISKTNLSTNTTNAPTPNNNDNASPPPTPPNEHILWTYRNNDHNNNNNNNNNNIQETMIAVMVWPLWDANVHKKKLSSDVIHIERNGIEESSILKLANNPNEPPLVSIADPNIVWLTDTKYNYKYWCERFAKKVIQAQDKRREWNNNNNNNKNGTATNTFLPLQWPIFVVDFTDLTTYKSCPPIEEAMGKDFVLYSKRSIVVTRKWNDTKKWVDLGEPLPRTTEEGRSYLHTPLVARTDTIETIQSIIQEQQQSNGRNNGNNTLSLADPIESLLDRPVDISHFWESASSSKDNNAAINPVASRLRDYINVLIRQHLNDTNHFIGLIGTPDIVGRRVAQVGFIQAMLQSKIIIVSQRDKWEDQYRLYEALVSGAMVMTDKIVAMPKGLQNGTSIVEFDSAEEFVRLVRYYLEHGEERIAIARRGREAAMMYHRSHHRMEEIILGRVVTKCDEANKNCPFVVHANENS